MTDMKKESKNSKLTITASQKNELLRLAIARLNNQIRSNKTNNYPDFFPRAEESAQISSRREFNQGDIINQLHGLDMQTLMNFDRRFGGLCELVCNFVFIEDLLGKSTSLQPNQLSVSQINKRDIQINYLKYKITPNKINQSQVKKSHILDVVGFFSKIIALLLDIYPCSIMSFKEQIKLITNNNNGDKVINTDIFKDKLNSIRQGTYLKFEVFNKSFSSFSGHSMLIKKTGKNEYSFFDPNDGEKLKVDIDKLEVLVNEGIKNYNGTNVAFIDAKDFKKKYLQSIDLQNNNPPTP